MANTFVTPTELASRVPEILRQRNGAQHLVSSSSNEFMGSVGDTVKVKVRTDLGSAYDYTGGAVTTTTLTQSTRDIQLVYRYAKDIVLTSQERTLDIRDFTNDVWLPAFSTIESSVNDLIIDTAYEGFQANVSGTAANLPATYQDATNAMQTLWDNGVSVDANFSALVSNAVWNNYANINENKSRDFNPNFAANNQMGMLSPIVNIDKWFNTGRVTTHDRGDVAGTILVKGASQTGTSLIIDGFASTGTIKAGTALTINGVTGRYVVTADATIALDTTNTATVVLNTALASSPADDAAVTIEAASVKNTIFHPSAIALATVAPTPRPSHNDAVANINGINFTTMFLESGADIVLHVESLVGVDIIEPDKGLAWRGTSA